MSRWIGTIALVALGCAACNGEAPQPPAAPTTTGAALEGVPPVVHGATIMGNVSAGAPLGATAAQVAGTSISSPLGYGPTAAPLAAMSVQVVGTSISSTVGKGGGFSLEGVPAGDVRLRFVASGVDASVALRPVQSGDVVSVLVAVAGTAAAVQSESRNAGGTVELEGRIESLTAADSSLVVAGWAVATNIRTTFRDGNNVTKTFADLAIGQRVHVKGTLGVESIVADSILIQNTNAAVPVNVNGIVDELNGSAASFEFLVGGRKIKGDAATVLYGDVGGSLPFAALKDGLRVEVKGEMRDGHVYAVRIHVNGATTPEPPRTDSASIEGPLTAKSGAEPELTLTIGGTTVTTTKDTVVQRRGDVQKLADLALGQTIHAVGTRLASGWIAARLLQIKDDEAGGAFTIEGPIGGLRGSCVTTLSFGVNGYSIVTTPATTFVPTTACGDLKNGMKVEVKGLRQADNSVTATEITKK
jgi:hypothetical protein